MVAVVMRQNLHELPDLVRLAKRWQFESVFVQHLCHDFSESTLPAQFRPMREFVQNQTLLEEAPARIEHHFRQARRLAGASSSSASCSKFGRLVHRFRADRMPGEENPARRNFR